MQVRLILFQAAQQALGFGDSFFQCNHGVDAASRVSTVPQQWQSASYKLDAGVGEFWDCVSGERGRARPSDRLGQRRVALQLLGYFSLKVVGQPFFKLIL